MFPIVIFRHMRRCLKLDDYACEKCGSRFAIRDDLDKHVRNAHPWSTSSTANAVQIPCDECGKSFSTESNLQIHKENFHKKGINKPLDCAPNRIDFAQNHIDTSKNIMDTAESLMEKSKTSERQVNHKHGPTTNSVRRSGRRVKKRHYDDMVYDEHEQDEGRRLDASKMKLTLEDLEDDDVADEDFSPPKKRKSLEW